VPPPSPAPGERGITEFILIDSRPARVYTNAMLRPPVRTCLAFLFLFLGAQRGSVAAKPETWIEVRSPDFVVLTNAGEKQGCRVAFQFEMIRAVFRQLFNISSAAKDPPITIIAAKDETSLKPLLPEFWAKKGSMHPAGIYLGGPEKNYVALRLDVTLNAETEEPFESIYHEYVHFLTRRMIAQIPLWMVEGLAEFYGNTRIESDRVYVGAPSASNLRVLHATPPLPLSTLFAVTASSPYYHEENKASIFYAESWALTHYLITRDWREKTHYFGEFLELLGKGTAPDEAARKAIGEPVRLQNELTQYIYRFAFTAARLPVPAKMDANDFPAQPASEAESLAIRADFLAHDRHFQEAQEMLEAALKLDPKLAAADESMGFVLSQQRKFDEATRWYSKAVALNSQSYLANYYYAMSLFKGVLRPDAETAAKAEASLRTAIKIAPDFAPAYASLAWLLASRRERLDEAHMMMITAVTLEPGNMSYRINTVNLLEMLGRGEDAVRVAKLAASMAKTPEEQTEALAALSNAEHFVESQGKVKDQVEALKKQLSEAEAAETCQTPTRVETGAANQEGSDSHQVEGEPPTPSSTSSLGGPAPRPEVVETLKEVAGTIQDVKCSGASTLEITLRSSAGLTQLYTHNYREISFSAVNFTPQGILNPCTDIKGLRARVAYHPAKDQPRQGEIVGVGLERK